MSDVPPPSINLLDMYNVRLPIRFQKGEDCWANAAASLVTFEVQRSNSKDRAYKHYQASVQHLNDHTFKDPTLRGSVECYKYTDAQDPKKYIWVERDDPKSFYECDGLAPLSYVERYGVCFELDYPYTGRFDSNHRIPNKSKIFVRDVTRIGSHAHAAKILAKGHAIIARVRVYPGFEDFKGEGIYNYMPTKEERKNSCGHIVLIIGCGEEDGQRYYIILNSWGRRWGNNGIAKVNCELIEPFAYVKGGAIIEVAKGKKNMAEGDEQTSCKKQKTKVEEGQANTEKNKPRENEKDKKDEDVSVSLLKIQIGLIRKVEQHPSTHSFPSTLTMKVHHLSHRLNFREILIIRNMLVFLVDIEIW